MFSEARKIDPFLREIHSVAKLTGMTIIIQQECGLRWPYEFIKQSVKLWLCRITIMPITLF